MTIIDDLLAVYTLVPGQVPGVGRVFDSLGPLDLFEVQALIVSAVGTWDVVVSDLIGILQGFPDVPRLNRGGAGHENLFVVGEGLGPLPGQGYRVCFLPGLWWVFVHLVQEKIPDWPGGQGCRRVCPGQNDVHGVKLKLQVFGCPEMIMLL